MKLPDENGAHFGTPGTDPVSGVRYIIDRTSRARVYLAGACPICGVSMLSSIPRPRGCGACKLGRVARNDDEPASDLSVDEGRPSA